VDAGVLPEINAAELEAQLARDSASLITAQTVSVQLLLQLKALLNLDAGADFDIAEPPVHMIPVMALICNPRRSIRMRWPYCPSKK
jgi:outer membrane protein